MALARKATVVSHKSGALAVGYASSGAGGPPVPRDFVGGLSSGFHTVPQAGDQVLTLYESADNPYPIQTISTTDTPNLLPALLAGESKITHPDGRTASGLFNNGISRIFRTSVGIGADITYDQIANQLIADVGSGSTLLMGDNTFSMTAGFGSSPGIISMQVGSAAAGKINLVGNIFASLAPQATANFGTLSVGSGAFDGSSAGHFVGSGSGTLIAGNAASGFAGNLLDLQVAGVRELGISAGGDVTWNGRLLSTSASGFSAATNKVTGLTSVTVTGNSTRGRLSVLWNTPAFNFPAFAATRAFTMTFSTPYASTPTVLLTAELGASLGPYSYSAVNVTANGFDVYFINPGTAAGIPSNNETDIIHYAVVG